VIKAYVEKQRRQPTKVAGSGNGRVEIGAVWTEPGGSNEGGASDGANGERLRAGRFLIEVARKRAPLAAAAPGMQ
jgi:hypothetical protein